MQLTLVVLGMILGLVYSSQTDGFIFDSNICLFAGLTLIMPTLFQVKFADVSLLLDYKVVIMKGFVLNYIMIPLIAIGIGMLSGSFGVAAGLFLLSVLSGGGMVMHWIKKSQGDASLGFLLLLINLLFVSLSIFMLHSFGMYSASFFDESYFDSVSVSNFSEKVLVLLIIIPFVVSRIVIVIKPLQNFIEKIRKYISYMSIFLILFYLFGLQSSQRLFELYDFEPELIYISAFSVLGFYMMTFALSYGVYNLKSPQEKAAFWHSVTRYITLALVISTFTTKTFGIAMILPIMFAYVVQIPFAIFMDKKMAP